MSSIITREEDLFNIMIDFVDNKSTSNVKVISIVGGAASGKSTLAHNFVEWLYRVKSKNACTLSTDDYVVGDRVYRRENLEGKDPLLKYKPSVLNDNIDTIKGLKGDDTCLVPTYNDVTGEAVDAKVYTKKISAVDYIIIEGDFHFVDNFDLLVYFDVDDDTRLLNRISRDKAVRNESNVEAITNNFHLRQKLQHIPYTAPVKDIADMVILADKASPSDRYTYSIKTK